MAKASMFLTGALGRRSYTAYSKKSDGLIGRGSLIFHKL